MKERKKVEKTTNKDRQSPDSPAAQMTEKELLKVHSQRLQRQQYMEYLLKQVAEVTYQYNCFENTSLLPFATVRQRQLLQYNHVTHPWKVSLLLTQFLYNKFCPEIGLLFIDITVVGVGKVRALLLLLW